MPRLRAPVDPYCRLNGRGTLVESEKESDPDLRALADYARGHATAVWRFPDGKLALSSHLLGDGKVPLVFGEEGASIGKTAMQAFNALHAQSHELQRKLDIGVKVEAQVRARTLDPVIEPKDPIDIAQSAINEAGVGGEIGGSLRAYLAGAPNLSDPARWTTGRRTLAGSRYLLPVFSALDRMGGPGKAIGKLISQRDDLKDRVASRALSVLQQQLSKLTPDEVAIGYQRFVEHGEVTNEARRPVLEAVYQAINAVDNEFYDSAQAMGLPVKEKIGPSPVTPTGRYFPHRWDAAALADKRLSVGLIDETIQSAAESGVQLSREQAIEYLEKVGGLGRGALDEQALISKLMQNAQRLGTKLTREEARRKIELFIRKDGERIAGSLERSRLGADGYVTDMRRAYTATWTRNSYRVSDAMVFGPRDEKLHRLMDAVEFSPELGPSDLKFVRDVYDLATGKARVELHGWARELKSVQGAKLSLAVLSNATQPLNTLISRGLVPFVKAARDAALNPRAFGGYLLKSGSPGTIAERAGALPVRMFETDATLRLANSGLGDYRDLGMAAALGRDEVGSSFGRGLARIADWSVEMSLKAFRFVENVNRSHAQRAGEYYFDQLREQIERRGAAALKHRAIEARLKELEFDPEKVVELVAKGDRMALDELRTISGLRTSNTTQFRNDYTALPLFANQSETGQFVMQFKNFSIQQAKFMMTEVSPRMARTDTQRWLRAVATVAGVYPAVGIALTSLRQNLIGPTVAGDELARRLEDPTIGNVIMAGLIGMTMAGGLGIVADVGATAALGNDFATRSFFIPPVASTAINGITTVGATMRAILNADPDELRTARAAILREFGGVGGILEQSLRREEGRAKTPIDPIEALTGKTAGEHLFGER